MKLTTREENRAAGAATAGSGYHRLPIAQKRAETIARMREPAVTCTVCDTQVMTTDLLAHLEQRCTGPREPGPGAKWVAWRAALTMVPKRRLLRWVAAGHVRYRGEPGDRLYLLRDLVLREAQRKARSSSAGDISVTRAIDAGWKP